MRAGVVNLLTAKRASSWLKVFIAGGIFILLGLVAIVWQTWVPHDSTSLITQEASIKETRGKEGLPWVKVTKPQREALPHTISMPANVSPLYRATLYAKVSGYVKWMGFDKGDRVKKGTVLAVIDAQEIEEVYKKADVDYQMKKLTFERLNAVWKENPNIIAKQDVDVARAATQAAKHLRDSRYALLQYTKVQAPFSGVITARYVDPGTLVQTAAGSSSQAYPLYTIMDLDTVRVYVNVPQEEALKVTEGMHVKLFSRDMAGKVWEATVTRTTKALDPATRTLLVEIDLPNKDGELQPGALLNATINLGQNKSVLKIPSHSIIAQGASASTKVFIVKKGKVHQVSVKVGARMGDWIEILEGLRGDEEVVVEGKEPLTEGQAVTTTSYTISS